jgi:hypothetical protein
MQKRQVSGADEINRTAVPEAPCYKGCELSGERALAEDTICGLNHLLERTVGEAAKNGPQVTRKHRRCHALAGYIAKQED